MKNQHNQNIFTKSYHFIVPVWGESYIDFFINFSLPSQLASKNLYGLEDLSSSLYHIFAREDEVDIILNSMVYKELCKLIPVKITFINIDGLTAHETMTFCHKQGILFANKYNAAIVFLNPDLVFSNYSFQNMERIVNEGKRVINITGIRLKKNSASEKLKQFLDDDKNCLDIPSAALMDIAIENLHPLTRHHFFEGKKEEFLIPACLLWKVENKKQKTHIQGLIAHGFHLHPLLVLPQKKYVEFGGTVDDDYAILACPEIEHSYVVADSSEILVCEFSEDNHSVKTSFYKGDPNEVAKWAHIHTNQYHRWLAQHSIRLKCSHHYDPILWENEEQKSLCTMKKVFDLLSVPLPILFLCYPITMIRKGLKNMNYYVEKNKKKFGFPKNIMAFKNYNCIFNKKCSYFKFSTYSFLKFLVFKFILRIHRFYVSIRLRFAVPDR